MMSGMLWYAVAIALGSVAIRLSGQVAHVPHQENFIIALDRVWGTVAPNLSAVFIKHLWAVADIQRLVEVVLSSSWPCWSDNDWAGHIRARIQAIFAANLLLDGFILFWFFPCDQLCLWSYSVDAVVSGAVVVPLYQWIAVILSIRCLLFICASLDLDIAHVHLVWLQLAHIRCWLTRGMLLCRLRKIQLNIDNIRILIFPDEQLWIQSDLSRCAKCCILGIPQARRRFFNNVLLLIYICWLFWRYHRTVIGALWISDINGLLLWVKWCLLHHLEVYTVMLVSLRTTL